MNGIALPELLKLSKEDYYVTLYGSIVENWEELKEDDPFCVSLRLRGGKGGFGSLLRSFRIYRSTNQEMCRDLTGRRLKDAEEEKKLKKWIEKKAAREAEKEKKKQDKIAKLKAGPGKHDFNDKEYQRTKTEILEKTDDAMEAGLKRAETLAVPSDFSVASQHSDEDETKPTTSKKRKGSPDSGEAGPEKKKKALKKLEKMKGLWGSEIAGLLTEEDLLSSSDEEGSDTSSESNESTKSDTVPPTNDGQDAQESSESSKASSKTLFTPRSVPQKETKDGSISSSSFQYQSGTPKLPEAPKDTVTAVPEVKQPKKKSSPAPQIDPASFKDIDLSTVSCAEDLHDFGMDHLKAELQKRGLKCGGALKERANRLWAVKGLKPEKYPKKLRAQN